MSKITSNLYQIQAVVQALFEPQAFETCPQAGLVNYSWRSCPSTRPFKIARDAKIHTFPLVLGTTYLIFGFLAVVEKGLVSDRD